MTEIGINSEILTQILDGRKTIEGRLGKAKFLAIRPGDIVSIREDVYDDGVIIKSRKRVAKIKVTSVEKFGSFKDMLANLGFQRLIPSAKSLEAACAEYDRYYSAEDEKEYGVLGISFQVLS